MGIHPEVFLATGYAVLLVVVALGLDYMARHSHIRSEKYRTAGFAYHHLHDAWICPEDQLLLRQETDHERRLVRYRGRPQVCNHCPSKADCTDSDDGREVVRAMDPWPHSEAGRFHRGISLTLVLVAALIISAEALRNHSVPESVLLASLLLVVMAIAWHLHTVFRASPSNFSVIGSSPPARVPPTAVRRGYRKDKNSRSRTTD